MEESIKFGFVREAIFTVDSKLYSTQRLGLSNNNPDDLIAP